MATPVWKAEEIGTPGGGLALGLGLGVVAVAGALFACTEKESKESQQVRRAEEIGTVGGGLALGLGLVAAAGAWLILFVCTATESKQPEIGDLIEISRGSSGRLPYQHWAVYVGDGLIVHSTPDAKAACTNSMRSFPNKKAFVRKQKLRVVVGTSKWKINNILDDEYVPRPKEIIVRDACAMDGKEWHYNLLKGNCEHFATWLRYGKPESQQGRRAEEIGIAGGGLALGLGLGVVIVAGAVFVYTSTESDPRRRPSNWPSNR